MYGIEMGDEQYWGFPRNEKELPLFADRFFPEHLLKKFEQPFLCGVKKIFQRFHAASRPNDLQIEQCPFSIFSVR